MRMIKAVIFDCFGVLTTDGWLAFCDKYFPDDDERRRAASELNRRTDTGLISSEQFESEIARLAGIDLREARQVIDAHVRNDALFDYIRDEIKPRYKVGLLSNVSEDYNDELFSPEQNAFFDERTFSFELGVLKPHPAMYETIAAKLGMLPEECVFIDDREPFAQGAREVGMKALQYKDMPQLRRELSTVLQEES